MAARQEEQAVARQDSARRRCRHAGTFAFSVVTGRTSRAQEVPTLLVEPVPPGAPLLLGVERGRPSSSASPWSCSG